MRAIIVEDELASREMLKGLLEDFFKDIQLLATARTTKEAVPLIRRHQPDIVFLDIELPNEDGFELLQHFNPIPFKIIFTTAFEEYAIRAFRISAIDYLLKPIEVGELREAIEKAAAAIKAPQPKHLEQLRNNYFGRDPKLSLATNDGFIFIKIEKIVRCKADGRYSIFYMDDGSKHVAVRTLGEFDHLLRDFDFLRVHRSQIINLNKIMKFIRGKPAEVMMEDKTKVAVSNAQREYLMEFLGLMD